MKRKKGSDGKKGINRRQFIKTTGLGLAAAGLSTVAPKLVKHARAAEKDHLLVGYVNPTTGPLAAFGEPTPWVDELCLDEINKKGGVYIDKLGKSVPVKWVNLDSQSNPTTAAELANRLVMKDKVDILMPCHTPDTVNPVCAVAERTKTPCIAVDAPFDDWMMGGPYKWSFLHFWSVKDGIFPVYTGMWDKLSTNKVVGGLWPNDPDGTGWSEYFGEHAPKKGYQVIDLGRFPFMQKDFGTHINAFKSKKAEIVTGVLIPPDFTTALRQFKQMGFGPKVITMGKAILFPSAVEALGSGLGPGLTTEIWWSPHHPFKSSLTGMSTKELCDNWEAKTKKQWTPPIGFKYSGWELVFDVMNRAKSFDKETIRKAMKDTKMDSIVGPVKYDDNNHSPTPLVGGQWVKGDKWPFELRIVYNDTAPDIPLTGTLTEMKW
jgi:branched-chain amino acid transport system substrate-binding protein